MIHSGYISVLTEPGTRACCRESIWGGDPEKVGAGAQKMFKGTDGKLFQGLVAQLVTLWATGDYSSWELFGEIMHHVSQNCSRHRDGIYPPILIWSRVALRCQLPCTSRIVLTS